MFMKNSSLYGAASYGDLETVKKLLAAGADCNGKTGNEGVRPLMTPLMTAALNGHRDIVQVLVASGANLENKNREGCAALSAEHGRFSSHLAPRTRDGFRFIVVAQTPTATIGPEDDIQLRRCQGIPTGRRLEPVDDPVSRLRL